MVWYRAISRAQQEVPTDTDVCLFFAIHTIDYSALLLLGSFRREATRISSFRIEYMVM